MLDLSTQEIQNDFLNELKGYIPELMVLTSKLETSPGDKNELSELHRLVHTVRGASSLVKLNALSSVASELEGLFEDILEHRQNLEKEVIETIQIALDYFDKYSVDNESQDLQQTDRVAEIIASLNARTSVLACANPTESRYNPRLSVIDNIHLTPTLLSR